MQHHNNGAFEKRNNYRIPDIVLKGVPRIETDSTKYQAGKRIATEAFSSRATKDSNNANVFRNIVVRKEEP